MEKEKTLSASAQKLYKIDRLAQLTKVPSRTIRFYTQNGLLAPPMLKGRTGYYDESHRRRLLQIRELKEEHYMPLKAIKAMLEREDHGEDIEFQLVTARKVFKPLVKSDGNRGLSVKELATQAEMATEEVEEIEAAGLLFKDRPDQKKPFSEDNVLLLRMIKKTTNLGVGLAVLEKYYARLQALVEMEIEEYYRACQGLRDELKHNPAAKERLMRTSLELIELSDHFLSVIHRKMVQSGAKEYLSQQE